MIIEKVNEATDEVLVALENLIPQLGSSKGPPTRNELTALIRSEGSLLLIARYPNQSSGIVGILTLIVYRVPTGIRGVVEDVVVDEKFRGRGIAKSLLTSAIELAREAGASQMTLTSNAKREAANALYQHMGFQRRESNLYIFYLT